MFDTPLLPFLFDKLRLKLTGKEVIVSGQCKQCGTCCRSINLRIDGSWVTSEKQFKRLVKKAPEYGCFQIIGKNEHGSLDFACTWLTDEGICKDHDHRLDICLEFPDKNIYFHQGVLPKGCGYSMAAEIPFKKLLKQNLAKMDDK